MSDPTATAHAPRWSHEPLEETLDGARRLTVSVADRMVRGGWEALAIEAGISRRRWRAHHPLVGDDARVIELVDGRPAFDTAAWERVASLAAGAVALPSRTADSLGVARSALRPPGRLPLRIVDLVRARRVRARRRRGERTLDADHARHAAAVERAVATALAAGDDGSALVTLPPYALAARLELLLDATREWSFPAFVDLAASDATTRLLRLLGERDFDPGPAFLRAAELQAGGGIVMPAHLEALAAIDDAPVDDQAALLAAWADGAAGWHAARDLLLEAPPLRADLAAARRVATATRGATPSADDDAAPGDDELPNHDPPLRDAAVRARRLTAMRELVARDRATHVAGIRALVWSLAQSLHSSGATNRVDDVFDLQVGELLRLARGGEAAAASVASQPGASNVDSPDELGDPGSDDVVREVRGIPASHGRGSGRVVVLEDPSLDVDVDGAVLVCRVTDPAWLPLMVRCAALVTERGGPLSHAAIVARELGLPTVVGAAGARAAARHAERASVDGGSGVVAFDPAP
ncbi:MAG: phosphoenolpyruvate synthase [Thermoleophilia bacterium]|nr:phosphoenolpyruvate synthase [Thermoleophilia bacterium]